MVRILSIVFAVLFVSGCGSKYPETAKVAGKVTYQGQPLSTGRVSFWPEKGRPAMGEIQSDGTYELTSFRKGDGAVPGRHRVSITSKQSVPPNAQKSPAAVEFIRGWGDNPGVEWLIPKKYEQAETSGLTADVHSGSNTIDFSLP